MPEPGRTLVLSTEDDLDTAESPNRTNADLLRGHGRLNAFADNPAAIPGHAAPDVLTLGFQSGRLGRHHGAAPPMDCPRLHTGPDRGQRGANGRNNLWR